VASRACRAATDPASAPVGRLKTTTRTIRARRPDGPFAFSRA
jgi:hypothetical protein